MTLFGSRSLVTSDDAVPHSARILRSDALMTLFGLSFGKTYPLSAAEIITALDDVVRHSLDHHL
jgi:hypothetical protein